MTTGETGLTSLGTKSVVYKLDFATASFAGFTVNDDKWAVGGVSRFLRPWNTSLVMIAEAASGRSK